MFVYVLFWVWICLGEGNGEIGWDRQKDIKGFIRGSCAVGLVIQIHIENEIYMFITASKYNDESIE